MTGTAARRGRDLTAEERRDVTEVLRKGVGALGVEDAIARAPRKKPDAAGRTRRMGHAVGKMVRQLVYWEGKGEADDDSIHKTGREWDESEAGLSRAQLRTARENAKDEGLLTYETGYRRDRRQTVLYRLNILEVARVVLRSEIENNTNRLDHERRPRHWERLEGEVRQWRETLKVLDRIAGDGGAEAVESGDAHENAPAIGVRNGVEKGENCDVFVHEGGEGDHPTPPTSPGTPAKLTPNPGEVDQGTRLTSPPTPAKLDPLQETTPESTVFEHATEPRMRAPHESSRLQRVGETSQNDDVSPATNYLRDEQQSPEDALREIGDALATRSAAKLSTQDEHDEDWYEDIPFDTEPVAQQYAADETVDVPFTDEEVELWNRLETECGLPDGHPRYCPCAACCVARERHASAYAAACRSRRDDQTEDVPS